MGLVALPEIALYDPIGSNRSTVRKGSALISKQVLMSSLEAGGFAVRLYNLKQGDDEEAYGAVTWKGVKLTKAMVGSSHLRIPPSEYWSTYFPERLAPIGSVFTDIGCDRKCDFKLLPWQEHCDLMKVIVRSGVPALTYCCIIGFEDDDDRALSLLEEGVTTLYEELRAINPQLYFQIAPFSLSPIPGTPQGQRFRASGLLRFEDPEIFGGIWVPCADTRHLSYGQIADR